MIPPSAGVHVAFTSELTRIAEAWRDSPHRPRVHAAVAAHWDRTIDEWILREDAPLLVRRAGGRGVEQRHRSGRSFVHVDNSPAHWAISAALMGMTPTLDEMLVELAAGRLPVTFALTAEEKKKAPKFAGLLSQSKVGNAVNAAAWKVCHIKRVGIGQKGETSGVEIGTLREATRLLLSPSNMFLVPGSHAGLGELREVIDVFAVPGCG